jgi:hypothetical protein
MAARKVFDVSPAKGQSGWDVTQGKGNVLSHHDRKTDAVKAGRRAATGAEPSQLRIRLANGQVQEERTYPRSSDPSRTPG